MISFCGRRGRPNEGGRSWADSQVPWGRSMPSAARSATRPGGNKPKLVSLVTTEGPDDSLRRAQQMNCPGPRAGLKRLRRSQPAIRSICPSQPEEAVAAIIEEAAFRGGEIGGAEGN